MEVSVEQVQRLMEIGCVAAGRGLFDQAESIFDGLQKIRPESELPKVGRAIGLMNHGKIGEAITQLKAAVEQNPDSDLAMSFLGMALHLGGLEEASKEVLQQVIDANHDEAAVALAQSLLES